MAEFSDEHLVHVVDAKLHNLNNVSVAFPRGAVVAFTGVSGSGKSSLAFGTIHGEAQRKYLESVAPFARRLIGSAVDPQVEIVDGCHPRLPLNSGPLPVGPVPMLVLLPPCRIRCGYYFLAPGTTPKKF